jgi:hypothetical protein
MQIWQVAVMALSWSVLVMSRAAAQDLELKPVDCKFGEDGRFRSEREYSIYLKHQKSEAFKYFDVNCDGILQKGELNAYLAWANAPDDIGKANYEVNERKFGYLKLPAKKPKPIPVIYHSGGLTIGPIVRDSFPDISVFSVDTDVDTGETFIGKKASLASGATFSWSRNFVAPNTMFAAKGVAALPVIWQSQIPIGGGVTFEGITLSPTVSFDKLQNSNAKLQTDDKDVLTYGGLAEIALGLPSINLTNFLRVRASQISSFSGPGKASQVTGEYQPVIYVENTLIPHLGIPKKLPVVPVLYELDAGARYQSVRRLSITDIDPIFARGPLVDRYGGFVALSIQSEQGPEAPVPEILQRILYNVTYVWLHDTRHSTTYPLLTQSLSFALDPDGHLALKLSYERGKVEETAKRDGVVKVGLAAKY